MNTEHTDFNKFGLPTALVEDLTRLGFKTPTPIQAAGIPPVMGGKDLLAIAPTGTGKTGAFSIPALANVATQNDKQVLILAPTRELAAQIFQFINNVALKRKVRGALLVGGESFGRQYADWSAGVDYLVATPGRLMDHVSRGLDLAHIGILVLDEVDRMLDMGFAPQIEEIVKTVPTERQTLLFSATMPPEILKLANRYLKDPVRITVGGTAEQAPKIREEKIQISGYEKPGVLLEQVKSREGKILIFTRTQGGTDQVAERLEENGIEAARLHGGRTQMERKRALDAFRRGRVRVLVATDIAARGIDVADIEVVINYDRAATKEDHLHRIGRTGRCGKEGVAITFFDGSRGGGGGFRRGGGFQPGGFRQGRPFIDRGPKKFSRSRRFGAPMANPDEIRNQQAEADSRPRNFGQRKPPVARDFGPRRFAERREGHSGSVRYFRNSESKPGVKPRFEKAAPAARPAKSGPNFVRGKKGAVRRGKPESASV